jgi:hypothetical protein
MRLQLSDAELFGSSSLLVQIEGPKGNKPSNFSQIETVSTLFIKLALWFQTFYQLPCFLWDKRCPTQSGAPRARKNL